MSVQLPPSIQHVHTTTLKGGLDGEGLGSDATGRLMGGGMLTWHLSATREDAALTLLVVRAGAVKVVEHFLSIL